MANCFQNGAVSVLHHLDSHNVERLEQELGQYRRINPVALVLPCRYSELEGPAFGGILGQLKRVMYLNEIVVALGHASFLDFRYARDCSALAER